MRSKLAVMSAVVFVVASASVQADIFDVCSGDPGLVVVLDIQTLRASMAGKQIFEGKTPIEFMSDIARTVRTDELAEWEKLPYRTAFENLGNKVSKMLIFGSGGELCFAVEGDFDTADFEKLMKQMSKHHKRTLRITVKTDYTHYDNEVDGMIIRDDNRVILGPPSAIEKLLKDRKPVAEQRFARIVRRLMDEKETCMAFSWSADGLIAGSIKAIDKNLVIRVTDRCRTVDQAIEAESSLPKEISRFVSGLDLPVATEIAKTIVDRDDDTIVVTCTLTSEAIRTSATGAVKMFSR